MRLACIDDDGNAIELHTAIGRDPYVVRGLLFDAIFTYPLLDSMECFMVEHDIRNTMVHFAMPEETRVRGFLVSRNLDVYSKQTARGHLVSLAFEYGGPLAALAVFYATFDVKKNEQANFTLSRLSEKLSDESRTELLKRSKTFPCSEAAGTWLNHIFNKLGINTRELASILWCLGIANIPKEIFFRARQPSKSWGTNGELVESPPDFRRVISDEHSCRKALDELERVGFVVVTDSSVSLDPKISELLRNELETTEWKYVAVKILSHVYPKHSETDPMIYRPLCELFLPQVQWICPYFNDSSMAPRLVQAPYLISQFIEVLLSSSAIQGNDWNNRVLTLASNLLSVLEMPNTTIVQDLQARVCIRQAWASYTYTNKEPQIDIGSPFDNRSNAFYAQLQLLKAKIFIKYNLILSARTALEAFSPCLYGSNMSTLEKIQHDWFDIYRARISMLEGQFQAAYDRLSSIPTNRSVQVTVRLAECLCELGRCEEACSLLQFQLATIPKKFHTYHRLQLALAHTQLFEYVKATNQGERNVLSSQHPLMLFQQLEHVTEPPTLYGKLRKLSILGGLAIIIHLDGEINRATAHWRTYLEYSKKFLAPGFTDMIATYSMAELELRLGNSVEGHLLRIKAETLLKSTGRQYHFPGLGTIWLDLLGRWHHEHSQRATNLE